MRALRGHARTEVDLRDRLPVRPRFGRVHGCRMTTSTAKALPRPRLSILPALEADIHPASACA
jgi:hypothetical protein